MYFSLLFFEQGYFSYYSRNNLGISYMHTLDINAGKCDNLPIPYRV